MKRRLLFLFLCLAAPLVAAADPGFLDLLLRCPAPQLLLSNNRALGAEPLQDRSADAENVRIPPGAVARAYRQRQEALRRARVKRGVAPDSASIGPTGWTSRGPHDVAGRTNALLVDPVNNQILYAGAASGGVWKSTDGGDSWAPIDDSMGNLVIGSMAFDGATSTTLYAGTGQRTGYDRNNLPGAGIFVSTDSGATWSLVPNTSQWFAVVALSADPGHGGTLLAAVDDGPNSTNSGIWQMTTTNGMVAWTQVVTGYGAGRQVAFEKDGQHAVAATVTAGGTATVFVSDDWGATFTPELSAQNSEVALACSPNDTSIVYANFGGTGQAELFKSTNSGHDYTPVSFSDGTCGQHPDICVLWLAPTSQNADDILVAGNDRLLRSLDHGQTFSYIANPATPAKPADPHVDTHCLVPDSHYDGVTDKVFYVCTDGGIYRTNDITTATGGNGSWTQRNSGYQTTQVYSASGNAAGNVTVFGGFQDNTVLSTTGSYYTGSSLDATIVYNTAADGGFTQIDRQTPSRWYFTTQNTNILRSDDSGATHVPISGDGALQGDQVGPSSISPIVLDPNNSGTLFTPGRTQLWRTRDATDPSPSWSPILAANTILAVAVAASNSNVIWEGQASGAIMMTSNGTADAPTWVSGDPNHLLPTRSINHITIDPDNPNLVYVAFNAWQSNNLWRTTDGGSTWQPMANGLPAAPVRDLARHPRSAVRLYAATDMGIYESENGGATWSAQDGPAAVSTNELQWLVGANILLAATHGRGMWTADVQSVPPFTPTGLVANASGTAQINVTWNAYDGAASYQVLRKSDGQPFAPVATTTTTSYLDTNVVAGKTYVYEVTTTINGLASSPSNADLATTTTFADDNQLLGKTVLALHLQQIRDAVNMVRAAAGLTALTWAQPVAHADPVRATDITDLRTGLSTAYTQLGLGSISWSEAIHTSTSIRATHYQELRDKVK